MIYFKTGWIMRSVSRTKLLFALIITLALLPSFCLGDDPWLTDAAEAQILTPPFRKTLYAGETARLAVLKDKVIRLNIGEGSKKALAVVIPLLEGKRSGPKEILKDEPLILTHSTLEADYFAFKVFTGELHLDVDVEDLPDVVVDEGKEAEIVLIPNHQATGRFVNASDFRSTCIYSFKSAGEDVSKSSDYNRTLTMEFKGSSVIKTWKTEADRLIVRAVRGKVLVKAGHPFQKGN